jgi:DNA-damage-inducible protein J
MDSKIKKEFDDVCAEAGINAATAFNMFARVVVCDRMFPFEVAADPFYSESNMRHVDAAIDRLESGLFTIHGLIGDEGDE